MKDKENIIKKKHGRYEILDTIRGLALTNMIAYHGIWNLVYLYGMNWEWYKSGKAAYIWQQAICQTFILLSGFCFLIGRGKIKNGLLISLLGAAITLVTGLVMPSNIVIFGVLTCLGFCIIISFLFKNIFLKVNPVFGGMVSLMLFLYTKQINRGILGLGDFGKIYVPDRYYKNLITAFLGFPAQDFYSTDYFSVMPWIFLFWTGLFLYRSLEKKDIWNHKIMKVKLPGFTWMGKHSLFLYMIHQPILYVTGEILLKGL